MALSDWLLPQPQLVGGPVLTPAHPPSGTNQPGRPAVPPPQMTWGDILTSMSNAQNVAGENKLREMQAQLYGLQGQQAQMGLDLFKNPDKLKQLLGLASPQAGQPASEPSPFGSLAPAKAEASPSSGTLSPAQIKQLALDTGFQGDAADKATAIVMAESGGNPDAVGDGGKSFGLSQINAPSWGPIAASAKGNPAQAMKLMYDISNGGQDFGPWSTYKNGAYRKFLTAASTTPVGAGLLPPPDGTTPSAPNPANIAPTFGSLAPGGPINPGIAGLEKFDPVQAALGGSMLEALHMPNIAKPLTDLYVNSPGFAAAKAGAEKWAGVAPELYTKWNSPMLARPGGGIMNPATGGVVGAMPTIQKIVDPATGQESFVYMTPNGGPGGAPNITPTSGVAGLGPAQRAELEKRGRESVPTAPPGSYVPPGSNAVQVAPGAPEAQRAMGVAGTPPTLRDITNPVTGAPEPHWTLPPLGVASLSAGPAQGAAQSPSSGTATPTSAPPPSAPQGAATDMGSGTALRGMSPLYSTGVEGMIKTDQERIEKTLQPQADKANDNIARGQLIQDLLPRIATGQWAEAKQDLSRLLIGLGVSSDMVKHNITDVSAGDVIQKNFLSQSAEAVRQMGAREPGSVISLFNKAYPRVETQENAIKLMQNVFLMQGMRQQDEFNLAQAQHAQAVGALAKGQSYEPLTKFTANFNAGPHSSLNYLRAAQAMSDDGVAWKDAKGPDFENIVALIPKGHHFLGPDGKPYVKN